MAKSVRKASKGAAPRRAGAAVRRRKPAPKNTLTAADCVREAARRLVAAKVTFAHGTSDPVAEAAFIVAETLNVHPGDFASIARRPVTSEQSACIRGLVDERIQTRKPLAYLLNKIYMRGVPFYVDERAIVPRSYIGELLDDYFADGNTMLMDTTRVRRVLDLCTGSGCLAVLAALTFPEAQIDAVDLSGEALAVAWRNVDEHRLHDRITLLRGDLFSPLGEDRYDLIISNPPYVDAEGMAGLPEECRHEPAMAFDGGADGIVLVRRIIDRLGEYLNPGGGLLCEVGRCRPALEKAYPRTPFLWLDSEESEGEVFWLAAKDLAEI